MISNSSSGDGILDNYSKQVLTTVAQRGDTAQGTASRARLGVAADTYISAQVSQPPGTYNKVITEEASTTQGNTITYWVDTSHYESTWVTYTEWVWVDTSWDEGVVDDSGETPIVTIIHHDSGYYDSYEYQVEQQVLVESGYWVTVTIDVPTPGVYLPGQNSLSLNALIDKSPVMSSQAKEFLKRGEIIWGPAGGGSRYEGERIPPRIILDSNMMGNDADAAGTLAHELGHDLHKATPDTSSLTAFVNSYTQSEGYATLNSIAVQRELASLNPPVTINIPGALSNHNSYNNIYNQFLNNGNAAAAASAIGGIYNFGEKISTLGGTMTYWDYYASFYVPNP